MSKTTIYQITALLPASSVMVLMEHDSKSPDEMEIKYGDFFEDDVTHVIDDTLKAHLATLGNKPKTNLPVLESILVTIEDDTVTLLSAAPVVKDRKARNQSSMGDSPAMETY